VRDPFAGTGRIHELRPDWETVGVEIEVNKVRLINHRIWQPSRKDPLDFEATIERSVLELRERFNVRKVLYDPA
jgi:hypothetical protein